MEGQPREERAEEDAAGVSSDLQRLFEESSFGSPEAHGAYAPPPPQLVTDIVNRVIAGAGIGRCATGQRIDGHRQDASHQALEADVDQTLQLHVDEQPHVAATTSSQRHDASSVAGDLTPDTSHAGASSELRARGCYAQSRDVSRGADRAVVESGSLLVPGGDLRMMSDGGRKETRARIAQWRALLTVCPAGSFGAEGSAMVLGMAAALAEALIANRDEHAALDLVQAVWPHVVFLGRRDPAGFAVRRARAEALSELGRYRHAESRLRGLSEDERQVFGSADPRTTLLLQWALVGQDRLRDAGDGFRSLAERLTGSRGAETLLLHVQCRRSWLLGRLGLVDLSMSNYARVIASRTNELGEDHADTYDALHSQAKLAVRAGRGAPALLLLQVLAEDRARVQGDCHPDTLETCKHLHLAQVQAEPGNDRLVRHAVRELAEIERIQQERHGRDHPTRQDTAAWLDKLLRGESITDRQPGPVGNEGPRQTIARSRHGSAGHPIDSLEQIAS